jgi:hypothetical protein
MGACHNRSIDAALDFVVQQIYAIRQNKDRVALPLLLSMT